MPTISQLPSANSASAADEVPISQDGTARAISIGAILASTQPTIIVASSSLLGRVSLGSGGPEQVAVGVGINLSGGALVANGLDHAAFPVASGLLIESDVVICSQGGPMLMQASLLRGLFSAGQNVAIDSNGVISATAVGTITGTVATGDFISNLSVVNEVLTQDLVAISHAGLDHAIAYDTFLGGMTIDQAQTAEPVGDQDRIWAAQSSNVMASQSFNAIWTWIMNKLTTYKFPVVEVTTNINLDATTHNGRILICSQPVTLTPLTHNMGSGFRCELINVSNGNITLGSAFISSTGGLILGPWLSATLSCASYSAGMIAFAAMPAIGSVATAPA